MDTTSHIDCTPASMTETPEKARALSRLLKTLPTLVRREIWIRREIARASALDDHILADIAVSRSEIRHAVRGQTSKLAKVVSD